MVECGGEEDEVKIKEGRQRINAGLVNKNDNRIFSNIELFQM